MDTQRYPILCRVSKYVLLFRGNSNGLMLSLATWKCYDPTTLTGASVALTTQLHTTTKSELLITENEVCND